MAEKIIVASGKGGSGKTSLTTGIALSFAKMERKVLVIDCDIAQGCIDFMLSARNENVYNWGDVILGNCDANEAIARSNGVDYFVAPVKWEDCFTSEALKEIISELEEEYDYILFDSPAGILGGFIIAAECADRALIVTTPDEVCVGTASRATTELFQMGIDDIRLIINRFDAPSVEGGKFLNVDETIDGVGIQLIGVIPEDKEVSYASTNGFTRLSDCPAKDAYERIARRIAGEIVHLGIEEEREKAKKGKKIALAVILSILIAVVLAVGAIFATDFYFAGNLCEPMFEIKPLTQTTDDTTVYTGIGYKYSVVKDDDGNIISTEMKIADRVISAAVS